jgi:hypothetical protein
MTNVDQPQRLLNRKQRPAHVQAWKWTASSRSSKPLTFKIRANEAFVLSFAARLNAIVTSEAQGAQSPPAPVAPPALQPSPVDRSGVPHIQYCSLLICRRAALPPVECPGSKFIIFSCFRLTCIFGEPCYDRWIWKH